MGHFLLSNLFLVISAVCLIVPFSSALDVDFAYHDYPQMTAILRRFNREHPELTKLYSIGKSVQGRELWVMLVTSEPNTEPLLKPNLKYVANMHGNEPVGREMMLHLLSYLLTNYGKDDYVTWLLDNNRLHIMPSMNPDGFELSVEGECSGTQGRGNANFQDLNRNFPDYFSSTNPVAQPETAAMREWITSTQFVLSANFHGGALVASYPFDNIPKNTPSNFRRMYSASVTPDDNVFRHLAESYSFNHKNMYLGVTCRDGNPPFPNGTTNGAAWYALQGGMQDFNYVWAGCMEITLEISCCKYPKAYTLPQFWNDNKAAILQYLKEAHQGVWGQVIDPSKSPVSNATIRIKGKEFGSRTTARGEYWRILLPGSYILQVEARGYEPTEIPIEVTKGVIIQNITVYPLATNEARSELNTRSGLFPSTSPVFNSGSSLKATWPTFTVNSNLETTKPFETFGDGFEFIMGDNITTNSSNENLENAETTQEISNLTTLDPNFIDSSHDRSTSRFVRAVPYYAVLGNIWAVLLHRQTFR